MSRRMIVLSRQSAYSASSCFASDEKKATITPESVLAVPKEMYEAPRLSMAAMKLTLVLSSLTLLALPLPAFIHAWRLNAIEFSQL